MTDHKAILSHYFSSRPISRTKELKTGQVHCAFADGTMAVYSVEQIEKMAEEMVLSYETIKAEVIKSCEELNITEFWPSNYLIH